MRTERCWTDAAWALGLLGFAVVLAAHSIVDGDLWARLAVGAQVWHTGRVLPQDIFAFTPTLPAWVDHEWGAGLIFYGVLNWLGPTGLMWLKIGTACGAVLLAAAAARRTTAALLLAIPCALAVLPGYVPVVRSHAFTFLFFGFTLLCLERVRDGRRWPLPTLVAVMLVWANVHGGFVVGLGTIGIYAMCVPACRRALLLTLGLAVGVTFLNPYGWRFWEYLIPALLHPRPDVPEWGPMPWWGLDPYIGFRIVFIVAVVLIVAAWRRLSLVGAVMLLVTAFVAIRSRRHAPFFGLAALVYLTPCLTVWLDRWKPRGPVVFAGYGVLTAAVVFWLLPRASLEPSVPNGYYPVRAVDVLEAAAVEGHLAIPFRWGSYVSWRLFPRIKVSVDGRYEETYPEETFRMNRDFFYKHGPRWDRLLTEHRVDFLIIELAATGLAPADLAERGYVLVYRDDATVLLARPAFAEALRQAAAALPPTTREPLDPQIPRRWLP